MISSYSRHRNIIPSAAPGSSAGSPGPQSPRVPEDCNRKCPVCKIQSFLAADHGRLRCTDLAILLCKISQCSWRVVQFPSSSTFRATPHDHLVPDGLMVLQDGKPTTIAEQTQGRRNSQTRRLEGSCPLDGCSSIHGRPTIEA